MAPSSLEKRSRTWILLVGVLVLICTAALWFEFTPGEEEAPIEPALALGCSLSGNIELMSSGNRLAPEKRVVVFVETVPVPAVPRQSQVHRLILSGLQFTPPVLVLTRGDSVEFQNNDKDEHHVFSRGTEAFDFGPSRQGRLGRKDFQLAGPVRVQCNIHEWERADLLVLDNPWFSLVGAEGRWRIDGLPSGKHTVVAWEPNGSAGKVVSESCGEVPRMALEQAKLPRVTRRDGSMFPVYQP